MCAPAPGSPWRCQPVLLQAPVSPSLGLLGDGLDPIPGWIGPYMGIDGGGMRGSGLLVKGLYSAAQIRLIPPTGMHLT